MHGARTKRDECAQIFGGARTPVKMQSGDRRVARGKSLVYLRAGRAASGPARTDPSRRRRRQFCSKRRTGGTRSRAVTAVRGFSGRNGSP